jgi:ribosome maturation factor RimP
VAPEWGSPTLFFGVRGLNEKVGTQQAIENIAERAAQDQGLTLVAVEVRGKTGSRQLRILLDKQGGIGVLDLQHASQQISALLDVENPVEGHYTLEVSSPGLDRPLTTHADFVRARGRLICLKLSEPSQGRSEWTGTLSEVTADALTLDLDGRPVTFSLPQVAGARIETALPRQPKRSNDKRPRGAHA